VSIMSPRSQDLVTLWGIKMKVSLKLPPETVEEFKRGKRAAIIKAVDELAPELILMQKGKFSLVLEGNRVKSSEVYHYQSYSEK